MPFVEFKKKEAKIYIYVVWYEYERNTAEQVKQINYVCIYTLKKGSSQSRNAKSQLN